MRAAWIVQLLVAGGLVAGAAWALERALLRLGRSLRWAWATGLVALLLGSGVVVTPNWLAPQHAGAPAPVAATTRPTVPLWLLVAMAQADTPAPPPAGWTPPAAIARLDRWVLPVWGIASLGMAGWLGVGALLVRRRSRRWRPAPTLGPDARVSPDGDGPLVAGVRRPRVVVPAWLLDDPRLPLVLAHERSHVAAGDPWLLAAAAVAVALLPWHPAAWWMARRLRVAVELDCDRRVLGPRGAPAAVRAYGALLLDVAARRRALPQPSHAATGWPLPALAGASALDRRIRTMTAPAPRRPARRALALGAAAVALAAGALALPRPVLRAEPGPGAAADTTPVARRTVDTVSAFRRATLPPMRVPNAGDEDATGDAPMRVARLHVSALGPAEQARLATVPEHGRTVVVTRSLRASVLPRDTVRVQADTVGGGRITVRQGASAPASTAPGVASFDSALVILDGVDRGHGMSLVNALDPDRIASVDVLKGDAATRQYGARGRHGVVRIVTKGAARRPAPGGADSVGTFGIATAASSDSMLVIVDGRVRGRGPGAFAGIAPDRIKSVEVFKRDTTGGADGTRDRHGIVRITTKDAPAPAAPRDTASGPRAVRGTIRVF